MNGESGGHVIPDAFLDVVFENVSTDNIYRQYFPAEPRRPLTRREWLQARVFDWRSRIETAVDVLRGRHECGYE